MKFLHLILILLAVVCLAACGPAAAPATPTPLPTPTAAPSPVPTATALPVLTVEQLMNFQYHTPQYDKTVTLKDGNYTAGSGTDYFSVVMQANVAFGDLNGDGLPDAAVLLAENGGGSGVFVSLLAMINQGGQPLQSGAVLIDDRPRVDSLAIQDGKIVLGALIHGPNDPMASPTLAVTETYTLAQDGLALVRFTSQTSDGQERSITIQSPAPGAQVGGTVQVKGEMPIAPFENTLAYSLYDAAGKELAKGPFAVQSNGAGGPATFDAAVSLPSLPSGTVVRLELSDLSAADGSPLAIDSVELKVE